MMRWVEGGKNGWWLKIRNLNGKNLIWGIVEEKKIFYSLELNEKINIIHPKQQY